MPEESLIGDFDADLVFFVEWPSQEAFYAFVQDPGYQAIQHLRDDAIRDVDAVDERSVVESTLVEDR